MLKLKTTLVALGLGSQVLGRAVLTDSAGGRRDLADFRDGLSARNLKDDFGYGAWSWKRTGIPGADGWSSSSAGAESGSSVSGGQGSSEASAHADASAQANGGGQGSGTASASAAASAGASSSGQSGANAGAKAGASAGSNAGSSSGANAGAHAGANSGANSGSKGKDCTSTEQSSTGCQTKASKPAQGATARTTIQFTSNGHCDSCTSTKQHASTSPQGASATQTHSATAVRSAGTHLPSAGTTFGTAWSSSWGTTFSTAQTASWGTTAGTTFATTVGTAVTATQTGSAGGSGSLETQVRKSINVAVTSAQFHVDKIVSVCKTGGDIGESVKTELQAIVKIIIDLKGQFDGFAQNGFKASASSFEAELRALCQILVSCCLAISSCASFSAVMSIIGDCFTSFDGACAGLFGVCATCFSGCIPLCASICKELGLDPSLCGRLGLSACGQVIFGITVSGIAGGVDPGIEAQCRGYLQAAIASIRGRADIIIAKCQEPGFEVLARCLVLKAELKGIVLCILDLKVKLDSCLAAGLQCKAEVFKAEIEAFLNCFCGIASAFAESECSWLLTKLVSLVCIELNLCLLKLFAVCRLCLVDFDVVCSGIIVRLGVPASDFSSIGLDCFVDFF